jgi:hypothetical protein
METIEEKELKFISVSYERMADGVWTERGFIIPEDNIEENGSLLILEDGVLPIATIFPKENIEKIKGNQKFLDVTLYWEFPKGADLKDVAYLPWGNLGYLTKIVDNRKQENVLKGEYYDFEYVGLCLNTMFGEQRALV